MTLGQKSFLCIVFWKNLDTNKSFCSDLIFIYIPAFFCSSLSGPLLNFDSDQNSSLLSEVGIQPTVLEPSGMSLNYKTFWCQSDAIICIIFYYFLQSPAPWFVQLFGSSKTETLNKILQKIKSNWNRLRQKQCWS